MQGVYSIELLYIMYLESVNKINYKFTANIYTFSMFIACIFLLYSL